MDLVTHLRMSGVAKSPEVINALQRVDRANYAPQFPYEDTPMPIGYGQTISAPHMHACKLILLLSNRNSFSIPNVVIIMNHSPLLPQLRWNICYPI